MHGKVYDMLEVFKTVDVNVTGVHKCQVLKNKKILIYCFHVNSSHLCNVRSLTEYLFALSGIGGSRMEKNLTGRRTTTVSPSSQAEARWSSPPRGMKILASISLFYMDEDF